jgi:hypothetical protein
MTNRLVKQANTTYIPAVVAVIGRPGYCVTLNDKPSFSGAGGIGGIGGIGGSSTGGNWLNPPIVGSGRFDPEYGWNLYA